VRSNKEAGGRVVTNAYSTESSRALDKEDPPSAQHAGEALKQVPSQASGGALRLT